MVPTLGHLANPLSSKRTTSASNSAAAIPGFATLTAIAGFVEEAVNRILRYGMLKNPHAARAKRMKSVERKKSERMGVDLIALTL